MAWSPQQERCLKDLVRFRDNDEPVFVIHGDAGTGKTTLSIEVLNIFDGMNCKAYGYTGKSASVLRKKGHHDAATFHSDLFIPAMQSRKRLEIAEGRYDLARDELEKAVLHEDKVRLRAEIAALSDAIAEEKEALSNPSFTLNTASPILDLDLLIADEISMIGSRLGLAVEETCRKGKVKMLLMGDPNQLPPVKDTAHFMQLKPNHHLTEIHRQAQDSPILHLAHRAKDRLELKHGKYGDSQVTTEKKISMQSFLDADQVLVGINETRAYYTRRMREERGFTDIVEVGEKLMCLRNSREGFFNGQIWFVEEIHEEDETNDQLYLTLRSEDVTQEPRHALVWKDSLRGKEMHWMDAQGAQSMVSAEAVTTHKFQGSEAGHVVGIDESHRACRDYPHRHLYTMITRAKDRIDIGL